jgi:hypothetical protein
VPEATHGADPSDAVYHQVLEIVRRVLRVDSLDTGQDFTELGATSLAIIHIASLVEQECGVLVDLLDAIEATDVDAFARTAAQRIGVDHRR